MYKRHHYVLARIDRELYDIINKEFKSDSVMDVSFREASHKLAQNYKNATSILKSQKKLFTFTLTSCFAFGTLYMIYSAVVALV